MNTFCDICKKITLFYLRKVRIYFYICKSCKGEFTTFKRQIDVLHTTCKYCKKQTELIFTKSIFYTHLCSECRTPAILDLDKDSNLKKIYYKR